MIDFGETGLLLPLFPLAAAHTHTPTSNPKLSESRLKSYNLTTIRSKLTPFDSMILLIESKFYDPGSYDSTTHDSTNRAPIRFRILILTTLVNNDAHNNQSAIHVA